MPATSAAGAGWAWGWRAQSCCCTTAAFTTARGTVWLSLARLKEGAAVRWSLAAASVPTRSTGCSCGTAGFCCSGTAASVGTAATACSCRTARRNCWATPSAATGPARWRCSWAMWRSARSSCRQTTRWTALLCCCRRTGLHVANLCRSSWSALPMAPPNQHPRPSQLGAVTTCVCSSSEQSA